MSLNIAVLKETAEHENRVSASVETVKKLSALGCVVTIETGAGINASITDQAFKDAGAKISKTAEDTLKSADIVLKVQPPSTSELQDIKKGTLLIGLLAPYSNEKLNDSLAKAGIDSFSMEMVPRISRAQSMDVLSSQSNLAGYKAVIDAASQYTSAFPMMMTAAGTVPPAKTFIMGAGVAGLQAIATARRLGAIVTATDVRPAAKEQVESLGASFVAVEDDEFKEAETSGGYAKEMSKEYQKKQADLVAKHIAKQDIVITTALIPGRPAPKLITEAMVKSMKPGSVIVDLAVETGGNCAVSKAGEVVKVHNVNILGYNNVPSRLATDASALYAKNLLNLLNLIIDKEKGELNIDWNDEIIKGIAITKDGEIIHPNFTSESKKQKTKTAPAKKASEEETSKSKDDTEDKTSKTKESPAKKAAS
ncbi:MAG: Re/Si-specific NAD(P)(+) transhydrogenase subunit alpha [Alphaproteobacteria bacterium]|nr:Re/Si-specific NAD(P)(+) transhydrogenase subunit alpha [Alphaproteobacteria bacterium]